MKRFFALLTVLVLPVISGCSLQSAPVIGGLFPSETPTAILTFTPTSTFTPISTATETPTFTPSLPYPHKPD